MRGVPAEAVRAEIITCTVCNEAVEPHTEATCNTCGKVYHLNQRTDLPGRDCGQVWISDEHLALEFTCDTCLNPSEPRTVLDEIVDLTEAAAATGLSEATLREAAERGQLSSRTLAGGILIFQRGDLQAFSQARP
jgi:hypothetical protein